MTRTKLLVLTVLGLATLGCRGSATGASAGAGPDGPTPGEGASAAQRSDASADDRLEIRLEILPGTTVDRVTMRTAVLHFRNVGTGPVRFYLPNGEAFRAGISTLVFDPDAAPAHVVPEPQPHGYVVTEADFHLLEPGAETSFEQPFTIDPFPPGDGDPARLAGFESGSTVPVRWTYENSLTRWEGGWQTLDGVTQPLFGGEEIPHIWTGQLAVRMEWQVP
jgi:hypothetical protein